MDLPARTSAPTEQRIVRAWCTACWRPFCWQWIGPLQEVHDISVCVAAVYAASAATELATLLMAGYGADTCLSVMMTPLLLCARNSGCARSVPAEGPSAAAIFARRDRREVKVESRVGARRGDFPGRRTCGPCAARRRNGHSGVVRRGGAIGRFVVSLAQYRRRVVLRRVCVALPVRLWPEDRTPECQARRVPDSWGVYKEVNFGNTRKADTPAHLDEPGMPGYGYY